MSAKTFQNIISHLKNSIDRTVGIIDADGTVVACTDLTRIGTIHHDTGEDDRTASESFRHHGYTYKFLTDGGKSDYAVFVDGEDEKSGMIADILAATTQSVKSTFDEKFDKATFIKNIILDNMLPSDIYSKSRELHLAQDASYAVYVIRYPEKNDFAPLQIIQNMFPNKNRDTVIAINDSETAIVREFKEKYDETEAESVARTICDTFGTEFFTNITVGIGTAVTNVKDLSRSYKEARTATEIGKVFDAKNSIFNYKRLGIGRLIYQLPSTLCELFLNEIFKPGVIESLDRETLATVDAFFGNSLNISETARKLFVHRNTLVYRLDKVQKITGLDLREFDNAVTFKVALMVKRYLNSKSSKY